MPAKIAVMRDNTLACPRTEKSASVRRHAEAAALAALKQDDDDHRGGDADVDDQQHQPPIVKKCSYAVHFRPYLRLRASSVFRRPWR